MKKTIITVGISFLFRAFVLGQPDSVFYCITDSSPLVISENQRWNDNIDIDRNIVIEKGATLTIHSRVALSQDASIIVKRGAMLIVDGGTITNACKGLWRGIEVHGTSDQPQQPNYQGTVVVENGGTIEHAETGIRAYRLLANGQPDYAYTGGIVICDSANFIDNRVAVEFLAYRNPNMGSFNNCHFLNTTGYLPGRTLADYFIRMTDVTDIHITRCTFENTCEQAAAGNGIYSLGSTFSVDQGCTSSLRPCPSYEPCKFIRLRRGIYATDYSTNSHVYIHGCEFTNTKRCVYISGIDGAQVTSNVFMLPLNDTIAAEKYGIYLNESTGYHIEDNYFTQDGERFGRCGIYVRNSGPYYNSIYNNTFDHVGYGIIAEGENRNGNYEGLCIKCNDFSNNIEDYSVVSPIGPYPAQNRGIAYHQGYRIANDTAPAGNTFTHPPIDYNIINGTGCNYFEYVYHDLHPDTVEVYPDSVSGNLSRYKQDNITYNKLTSCPSKLEGGGEGGKEMMQQSSMEIETREAQLTSMVDGGNTEEINTEVQTSFPDEAEELRQDLLNESPYLSDTVMKSAIYKEEVLPSAMIRDVLVANPQSAKSQDLLDALDDRFVTIPDYMMDEIMQGRNIIGSKEALEADIAWWRQEYGKTFDKLFYLYRNDTINSYANDSLIDLLVSEPSLRGKYRLAYAYFYQDNIDDMNSVLDDIPFSFNFDDAGQMEYDNYVTLFGILEQLQTDTSGLQDMDSMSVNTLLTMANDDYIMPGVYARNILIALDKLQYDEPFNFPENLKSSVMDYSFSKNESSVQDKPYLKVFPNPAGDYIIIEFESINDSNNITFRITDTYGKLIQEMNLNKMRDQVVIKTKNWKQGLYLIQMIRNNKVQNQTKFILSR